jgi:hypothetical protein
MPGGAEAAESRRRRLYLSGVAATLAMAAVILAAASANLADDTPIPPLADKTLVAWVAPQDLAQRGGSVLTIERRGGIFDAIVLG